MSEPLLEVRDLRVAIGDRDAAHPVDAVAGASLHAARGEVVGVVGESGSGKSLTLRAIAGLLPRATYVRGGQVRVAGIDVVRASEPDLRRLRGGTVGMVFQEPMSALNPTMRIGAQISEAARLHLGLSRAAARERSVELLVRMGFPDPARRLDVFPHELSGGMRQRVVIALALAGEPSLLLCDEPTTALDATVTQQVLDLLLGLADELDVAVVLVTHDLGVVARTCERIAVMYAGRIVEDGPAAQVLRHPRHPYTLALLRAVPTRDRRIEELRAIPGAPPNLGDIPLGCPFVPRCSFAEARCSEPLTVVAIDEHHRTACRRHELLAPAAEVRLG